MAWHVLYTHVAQEQRLARFLAERNVLVFAPEIKITKPRKLVQPFFPRYVLACVDLKNGDCKALVKNAHGLHSILEFCGQPATVSVSEILLIQSRIRDGFVMLDGYTEADSLRPGSKVEIVGDGLFSGLTGIFDKRLNGSDRVRILLAASQGLFSGQKAEVLRSDVVVVLPEECQ